MKTRNFYLSYLNRMKELRSFAECENLRNSSPSSIAKIGLRP